ncbi:hypothetical protein TDB9533_00527 [Thalassocella blandensis]|nr:hypothetical protein TDB9533_00527 [Thalassocella blandensis]
MTKDDVVMTAGAPAAWTSRALFTVVFLGLSAGIQLSDQGIQSLSLSAIQQTFDVSDSALGALQGLAGILIGSLLAIPLSRFVDKYSRKRILLCLVAASTSMTVLSAFAPNFILFFLGRSSTGIIEFAMIPLVYSMIPDLAPERDRVLANLGFAGLMAAGASGGYYFGGAIIDAGEAFFPFAIEAWRKGFLVVAVLGLPLFVLGLLTLDPVRRVTEQGEATANSIVAFIREHWKEITLFIGLAGFLLIAVQALNQLIALALDRRFDATITTIGQAMGMLLLMASTCCLPIAGVLDRVLTRFLGRAARPAIMAGGAIASVPVLLMLFNASNINQAYTAIGLFLLLTSTANVLVPTILQDLIAAPIRARCFAIWSFLVSIFSAVGPLVAGMLSDWAYQNELMTAITVTAIPALVLSAVFAFNLVMLQRESAVNNELQLA